MNRIYHKSVLFLIGLLLPVWAISQTTLTTVYSPLSNSSGGGTDGSITFALENTTAGPMEITDLGYYMPSNTTRTWSLWYRPGAITGSPAPIAVGNGWIEITTPTSATSTVADITPIFSNMSFVIPANTTYWFALTSDASTINYGGASTAPNIFSGGGVNLLVGDNNPGTGHVGYAGAQLSLPFNPRFFRGFVTFRPSTPCDDPSIVFPTTDVSTVDQDTICPGTMVELLAGSSMPGASGMTFQWQIANASTGPWTDIDTPQAGLSYSLPVDSTSYFRVEVYCNAGLELVTDPVQVFVVDPQIVEVHDSFRCGEGSVTLNVTPTSNTVIAWYADSADGLPLDFGETFTTPYLTETDTFYVSAGIAIAEGDTSLVCETIERQMVIATVLPVPDLDLGNDINICVDNGEYIMLNAGVHPYDPEYLWDDQSTSQILAIDSSGFHYVTVTNNYNCSRSDSINVILRNNPDLDLGQDTSVCKGAEVTLHAGSDGINYFWSTGSIDSVITVGDSGTYSVIVTNGQGCTKSDTIVVHMNGESPVVQGIIVDNLGPFTFRFEAFNPQNVTGYEWDFGDGSLFSYEDAPVHTYADEGTYIVTLRINSSCGFWSDVVSANVVAIKDVDPSKEDLLVYPNPTDGEARILNKSIDLRMEQVFIYDAMGREVYKKVADNERTHDLSLETLNSGIYTIKIQVNRGFVYRKIQVIR